jgi:hypothetical protein
MAEMEREIRRRYLDRMDDPTWDAEDPRMDFGVGALPYFVAAFGKENVPERRARLVRVIWQFRDRVALPTLAIAVNDPSSDVWKEALDGIVTLGGPQAVTILEEARAAIVAAPEKDERISWLDEAIRQVTEGFFGRDAEEKGI